MPGDNEIRKEPSVAPADVDKAFKLWLVSIGIGVLGIIASIAFADRQALIDQAMKNSAALTRDEASTGVTIGLVVGAVVALIIIGLELFFAFKMRAGRNWARIVLTVVGILGVLFGLFGLTNGLTIATVLNLISIIVVIAAIVFMFRPASGAYFSRPK
ncbi:MAG: hypothetical protein M3Y19_11010 [Actinomycetota bacterium]|nr:hypothetical protein [Actinomycetota bacterium]